MPHLSPMNWPLSLLFLFSLITLLLAQNWWQPQPSFPSALSFLSPKPMLTWQWL